MAKATSKLIKALRLTADSLRNGAYHSWGHHGACNCGNLVQSVTKFTKEEILFLYEMNIKINGFGYHKDPRIEKIKSERDLKSDIMFAYDNKYTRDEITTTTEEFARWCHLWPRT